MKEEEQARREREVEGSGDEIASSAFYLTYDHPIDTAWRIVYVLLTSIEFVLLLFVLTDCDDRL